MSKISAATKLISFAVLIALMLAPFTTINAAAKASHPALEAKWDQLVSNYNRQSVNHDSVHHWVDVWMMRNRTASSSDKAEIQKHLTICNTALVTATTIVMKHEGFDAKGQLVDKAAARKSVKDLNAVLLLHAASVRNLQAHVN